MHERVGTADSRPWLSGQVIASYLFFIYFSVVPALFFYLPTQYEEAASTLVFTCVLTVVWVVISLLLRTVAIQPAITGIVTTFFSALFITMGLLHLSVYLYFHQEITVDTYFILFETNWNEVTETVAMYFDYRSVYLLLFVAFPFIIRGIAARLAVNADISKYFVVALVATILVNITVLTDSLRSKYNPLALSIHALVEYQAEIESYRRIATDTQDRGVVRSISKAETNLYVLVMGESTTRNHMSLYGYDRSTNPRLSELTDELYVFSDVVSPHSHTIPVFKKALFLRERESAANWADAQTLVSVFKDAGFETIWLSNQEQYSIYDNVVDSIASQADIRVYTSDLSTEDDSVSYDGELLPILDDVLTQSGSANRFIMIHLMGTHAAYDRRYPPAYDHFDAAGVDPKGRDFLTPDARMLISYYDNGVLYNDYIVAEIIERVRREQQNGYVLYLSDHGEEVFEQRNFAGHTENFGSRYMIEIPFVIWLSDAYRANHADKRKAIMSSLDNRYMTDDLTHTIVDLSLLETDRFDPRRSVISPLYDNARSRIYNQSDYDTELRHKQDRYLVPEKFWVHRVNSIEKFGQVASIFAGVELDLVVQTGPTGIYFDVTHPPVESIGLTLDSYFRRTSQNRISYWLDIKNLSDGNAAAVLDAMEHLVEKYEITKDRLILESSSPTSLLEFARHDYYTSYYLQFPQMAELNGTQLADLTEATVENIQLGQVAAVSFPSEMYDFVSNRISPLTVHTDLLTWHIKAQLQPDDVAFVQQLLRDDKVKVLLMHYSTPFDR
jgi:heptose-I-phosphate ethanolaminephosphotransferase|tara:strand:+ start:584 stop:2938 length:2355 start_codon:yes stop_codon:yes gene_type:complete